MTTSSNMLAERILSSGTQEGHGTLRDGRDPLEEARATNTGSLPRGTETVLVVEDDPSVRDLAYEVLKTQGYEVLVASDGEEALQAAREHRGARIRLVFSDIIMPNMGAQAMAEWLKTAHPGLKFLFTSGHPDEAIRRHGVLEAGAAFLPKPYTPATLAHKVRKLLDQAGEPKPEDVLDAPSSSRFA